MSIVLSIGRYEQYTSRYIIIEGLSKRYKSPILAHIQYIVTIGYENPLSGTDLYSIFRTLNKKKELT